MTSLRQRAVAGGIAWATTVTFSGSYILGTYLDQQAQSRFDDLLLARHNQAVVALANSQGDQDGMSEQLRDPIYLRSFSGDYWQVQNDADTIAVSRSLADALLPDVRNIATELTLHTVLGPANQKLRQAVQEVSLDNGESWIVKVASDMSKLAHDRAHLRQRMNTTFALIGILATIGTVLLMVFILRPLGRLRSEVVARWETAGELSTDDYPEEVLPLVTDINKLLERNRDIIGRSRRQAADLAHALKTPSAIMRNELEALQSQGVAVDASLEALTRLDGQLKRSFARMRSSQEDAKDQSFTDLDQSLGRMARAFTRLAGNRDRQMETDITPGMQARINQSDLEEIIGNLLDNALKWSNANIRLGAIRVRETVVIKVEDDGPGIPTEDRARAMSSGQRLDESKPGTGLGLALANDIVTAYGGSLQIRDSNRLGGACIVITLPSGRGKA